MSVAVLADIGMAAISQGEVDDKLAHQCSRSACERYLPHLVFPTAGVGKFKHLARPSLNEDIYETGIPGDYAFLGSRREWRFNIFVFS